MLAWEGDGAMLQCPAELDSCFSPEEARQLTDLQRRYGPLLHYHELGFDVRRLEFALWLVRTGRLSENVAAGEPPPETRAA